jgi:hypothetical protein
MRLREEASIDAQGAIIGAIGILAFVSSRRLASNPMGSERGRARIVITAAAPPPDPSNL